METPRDKYYKELYRTIIYCNDINGAPFSNESIRYTILRVIVEEESEDHNVTMDTFCQSHITPNTQGDNANMVMTS